MNDPFTLDFEAPMARTKITELQAIALHSMRRRVFWLDTDGGEPGDGAWYWVDTDDRGESVGEPSAPYESAFNAAAAAIRAPFSSDSGAKR